MCPTHDPHTPNTLAPDTRPTYTHTKKQEELGAYVRNKHIHTNTTQITNARSHGPVTRYNSGTATTTTATATRNRKCASKWKVCLRVCVCVCGRVPTTTTIATAAAAALCWCEMHTCVQSVARAPRPTIVTFIRRHGYLSYHSVVYCTMQNSIILHSVCLLRICVSDGREGFLKSLNVAGARLRALL